MLRMVALGLTASVPSSSVLFFGHIGYASSGVLVNSSRLAAVCHGCDLVLLNPKSRTKQARTNAQRGWRIRPT